MNDPIQVSLSPWWAQLMSLIRDLLKAVGAIMATKGIVDQSLVEPVLGIACFVGPVIWSQAVVRLKHAKLVVLADAAPDSVGEVVR